HYFLMKYVILLGGAECAQARGLAVALREAGVHVAAVGAGADSHEAEAARVRAELESEPRAVLFDLEAGAELADLHARVARAVVAWPGVPLVACRHDASENGKRSAQRFDEATLKRLGFHAVAAEAAQLSALLREVEERGTEEDQQAEGSPDIAPASLLLPEHLSVERLRAAFEVVASLHLAADQRGAASAALAGLAALVEADRWTIYLVGESGPLGDSPFEPLAVRGLTESERFAPDTDWRRALLGDALSLAGSESRATRAAAASAEVFRRKEGERRVVAVPLVSGERVSGVLEAVREGARARSFTRAEASLLSALALPLAA